MFILLFSNPHVRGPVSDAPGQLVVCPINLVPNGAQLPQFHRNTHPTYVGMLSAEEAFRKIWHVIFRYPCFTELVFFLLFSSLAKPSTSVHLVFPPFKMLEIERVDNAVGSLYQSAPMTSHLCSGVLYYVCTCSVYACDLLHIQDFSIIWALRFRPARWTLILGGNGTIICSRV